MSFTKTVLITGAARRIGAAIVELLVANDMRVILHYHTSQAEAEALAALCEQKNPGSIALLIAADLTQPAECDRVAQEALAAVGTIDVLINNASRFYPTPLGEMTLSAWDDLMNSNVRAALLLTQAFYQTLRTSEGCVVNITDIHAEQPLKNYAIYSMAKAAWKMQTKAFAKEFAPFVRVNAVAPGSVMPPEGVNTLNAERIQKLIEATALKRLGSPKDVAQAVLFLIQSNYITGQTLHVDGGRMQQREC